MKKRIGLISSGAALLLLSSCTLPWQSAPAPTPTPAPAKEKSSMEEMMEDKDEEMEEMMNQVVEVDLGALNDSGEMGKAKLEEVNGQVVVTLTLTGAPASADQPAHIHMGACPTPGAVKYPLTDVMNGSSQTTLSVSMNQLMSELPLAINVHKSAAEVSTYVSCGDISQNGSHMMEGEGMMNDDMMEDGGMMKNDSDGSKEEEETPETKSGY